MAMFKVYIGKHDENNDLLKIGYTEQTCWARCSHDDYHIFAAREFWDATLSFGEQLFLESYVRMAFQEMAEVKRGVRTDYFEINRSMITESIEDWATKWLLQFLFEAVEILNTKRDFTDTPHIQNNPRFVNDLTSNIQGFIYRGYVRPYSY